MNLDLQEEYQNFNRLITYNEKYDKISEFEKFLNEKKTKLKAESHLTLSAFNRNKISKEIDKYNLLLESIVEIKKEVWLKLDKRFNKEKDRLIEKVESEILEQERKESMYIEKDINQLENFRSRIYGLELGKLHKFLSKDVCFKKYFDEKNKKITEIQEEKEI